MLLLGTPVMLLPEGSVPVNSKVVEVINIVKPQAIELIDYANNVCLEVFIQSGLVQCELVVQVLHSE